MPIPEVFEAPSMVIGADGIGRDRRLVAGQLEARDVDEVGSPLAGRLRRIGPALVVMVTLAGTTRGSVSPRRATTVWPDDADDDDLRAGRTAKPLATCSACVTVLKLQLGVATPAGDAAARGGARRCRSWDRRSTCCRWPPSSRCSCCSRSGRSSRTLGLPAQSASSAAVAGRAQVVAAEVARCSRRTGRWRCRRR